MTAALVGNPNCGKTTLFNRLTGADVRVGNFPGVTVSVSTGTVRALPGCELADLPGIYSLSGISEDERCAVRFLSDVKPDLIISVIDGTTLSRGLYLTLRLTSIGTPMIVVVTMMDEVYSRGGEVDFDVLSRELGFPVVGVSSSDTASVEKLMTLIGEGGRMPRRRWHFSDSRLTSCLERLEAHCRERKDAVLSAAFSAEMIFTEGGCGGLPASLVREIKQVEAERRMDADEILATACYGEVDRICGSIVKAAGERGRNTADRLLTGKRSRLIFALMILAVIALTFGVLSPAVTSILDGGIVRLSGVCSSLLAEVNASPVVSCIICDGIIGGVGSVLSFLPVILIFFFFLSLIEDSGCAARAAYIFDSPMRRLGLSGRCVLPLITGSGCSVPAIMSTRTLTSGSERAICIFFIPFISCSAKIPVYTALGAALFGGRSTAAIVILYVFAVSVGAAASYAVTRLLGRREDVFVLEMPPYRMPSAGSVISLMKRRAREFVSKAFSVIFISSVAVSLLRSLTTSFTVAESPSDSLLLKLGDIIAPIFTPLGFGSAAFAAAVLCGATAKEAVISTLAIILSSPGVPLTESLSSAISPAGGVAFLVFVALGVPCIASVATVRRETTLKRTVFLVLMWAVVSYAVSFVAYRAALFLL